MINKKIRKTPEEREGWFKLMSILESKMCECCRSIICLTEIIEYNRKEGKQECHH